MIHIHEAKGAISTDTSIAVDLAKYGRRSRRQLFLGQINQVVPWSELLALVEPVYPKAGKGQQMVGLSIMLWTISCNSVLTFLIPASRKRFMIPQCFSAWREWTSSGAHQQQRRGTFQRLNLYPSKQRPLARSPAWLFSSTHRTRAFSQSMGND